MNTAKFQVTDLTKEAIDLTEDLNVYVASVTIGGSDVKTKVVDIPYANGSLDLTNYYGDEAPVKNISISIKGLIISNVYDTFFALKEAVHGNKMRIYLSQDATHYYIGRISVGSMQVTKEGTVTISCDCEPTRYEVG